MQKNTLSDSARLTKKRLPEGRLGYMMLTCKHYRYTIGILLLMAVHAGAPEYEYVTGSNYPNSGGSECDKTHPEHQER